MELLHRTKSDGMTMVFLGKSEVGSLAGLNAEGFGVEDIGVFAGFVELTGEITDFFSFLSSDLLIVYTLGVKFYRLQLTTTSTFEPFEK